MGTRNENHLLLDQCVYFYVMCLLLCCVCMKTVVLQYRQKATGKWSVNLTFQRRNECFLVFQNLIKIEIFIKLWNLLLC